MTVTIGVDIGGTKIAGGLVDEAGTVLLRARRDTPARSSGLVVRRHRRGGAGAGRRRGRGRPRPGRGVGLGAAGFVDETRSIVRFAPNLGWQEERLGHAVAAETGLPTVVENDANAAAWGEYRFGAGRRQHDRSSS